MRCKNGGFIIELSFEPGMKEQRSDESENDEVMCAKWVGYERGRDHCCCF